MDGGVWVPEEPDHWRAIPEGVVKRCRMQLSSARCCAKPAVMELNRYHHKRRKSLWWAYCEEHAYGRKLVNGVVMTEVHPDCPEAQSATVNDYQI